MDEPTSFPTWRFYADGRQVIVHTPEELAALPTGHAGSPAGPFPAPPTLPDPAPPAHDQGGEGPSPTDHRARVQQLRDEGLSRRAIADTLGVTEYTVRRLLEDP